MTLRQVPWLGALAGALLTVTTTIAAPPTAGDDPMIEFVERPGELARSLRGPELRVYSDGTVVRVRPAYMKDPGTHALRLSTAELDALVDSLLDSDLADFDPARAREARRSARERRERGTARAPLQYTSDPGVVEIRLRLGDGHARSRGPVDTEIVWKGLRADRRDLPDVTEIQGLARAVDELRSLRRRPDFENVDAP